MGVGPRRAGGAGIGKGRGMLRRWKIPDGLAERGRQTPTEDARDPGGRGVTRSHHEWTRAIQGVRLLGGT